MTGGRDTFKAFPTVNTSREVTCLEICVGLADNRFLLSD